MSDDKLLREAASLALAWSRELCVQHPDGSSGCDAYHGAWPTLRLIGTITGARTDQDFFQKAFAAQAHDMAVARVLITGSADYAMLEQVVTGFRAAGMAPRVTVVDQCPTTLALNRWYGQQVGAQVETHPADVLEFTADEPFDLVTTHSILSFVPAERHADLFGAWRRQLRPGGRLVFAQGVRPAYRGPPVHTFSVQEIDHFVERAQADFRRQGRVLHVTEAELVLLARRFARNKSLFMLTESRGIRRDLELAGFRMLQFEDVDRRRLAYGSSNADAAERASSARVVALAV